VREYCEPCKHIWATIIRADTGANLRGPSGDIPSRLELDESIVNDEVDEAYYDEWDDEPAIIPLRSRDNSPPHLPPRKSPPAPGKPPLPDWKQQIAKVRDGVVQHATPHDTRMLAWPPGREILYVVDVESTTKSSALTLEVMYRDRKMKGDWAKPKSRPMSMEEINRLPDPADRQIISTLCGARAQPQYGYSYYSYYDTTQVRFVVPRPMWVSIMESMCRTGRCVARRSDSEAEWRPLTWDDAGPWELWLAVERDESAKNYVLAASLRRGDERLPIAPPVEFLLDELVFMQDRVARLEHFESVGWFQHLRALGRMTVPASDGLELVAELLGMPKRPKLELPAELEFEHATAPPRPCLKVRAPDKNIWGSTPSRLVAEFAFDYEGTVIPNHEPNELIVQRDRRRVICRDMPAEVAAYNELRRLGFKPASAWSGDNASLELTPKHLPRVVAELLAAGWHVEADGKLYRKPGEIKIEVNSGIDWFELHGSVEYGDSSASLPTLLAALKKGQNTVLLSDGTFGLLPEEWLKKYGVLAGLGTAGDDHLRFTRSQVGLLDALLASQPEATCDAVFTRAREELTRFAGVRPLDEPACFVGELRGYQRDGLGWLDFLNQFGFGGCLADDMGLGKTIQVLALLERRRELRAARGAGDESSSPQQKSARKTNGNSDAAPDMPVAARPAPSLVVVPKSLVFNWKQEAARFTPQLRVLDHTGSDRTKGVDHFDDYDVVLTTYGTLRRDAIDFKDATFDYVILDEAQAVKNANTESAKAVRLIRGNHRLALSGTPVENHLGELWSLFDFLNPGMLGAASVLRLGCAGARNPDPATRELLARALRPFILRRTKEQVAKDLPPKLEQTIFCELEPAQRNLYDELRDHYRNVLLDRVARDGINKSKIQILEALLRLRQAACHPGLIDKSRTAEPCAKLDVLVPQIDEVMDEGHKVLVFSQFTSMLAILRNRLDAQKVKYEYLDGKTRDRKARAESFQNDPNCKLFLVSLKAGGLGLNLTAAEYVFLLDPW
jgi:hypothetical protein